VNSRTATGRAEQNLTAAVSRATGKFWCSSSAHFATGVPVMIKGRRVCAKCADQRRQVLKGNARG